MATTTKTKAAPAAQTKVSGTNGTLPAGQELDVLIGDIEKNKRGDKVRTRLTSYKGKVSLDIRLFYEDDNEEMRPTAKGTGIPVTHIGILKKHIERAEQEAKKRGLI